MPSIVVSIILFHHWNLSWFEFLFTLRSFTIYICVWAPMCCFILFLYYFILDEAVVAVENKKSKEKQKQQP